ncbi:MAG TPA: CopD family protein [Gemmatimonadaceae bacterium]|nr:CopD family protein [Gemmatimonadaceae bacterium]
MRLPGTAWLLPLLLAATAVAAGAHGVLLRSSPAAGENLAVAPREIRLVFNERPERVFTRIALLSPEGVSVALDTIVIGPGNTATARVSGALRSGLHTVTWRTAGRDGHPVGGEFTFSIAPDAAGITREPPAVAPAPSTQSGIPAPAVSESPTVFAPLAALLRWLTLGALIAAMGAIAFRAVVISRVAREMDVDISTVYLPQITRGAARLGLAAASTLLLVAGLQLAMQSRALEVAGAGAIGAAGMLTGSTWGWAWMLKVVSAALAAAAFAGIRTPGDRAWLVAAGGSVAAVAAVALSGHAVVVTQLVVATVIAHVIHTAAAAGWLGTLLVIAVVGLPHAFRLERDDRWTVVADIVHAFSPAALVFAGVTVAAGLFMSWTHLPDLQSLWTSEYGQLLLLKLALVGSTAAVGAYNWRWVRPSLGARAGARRLRRSAAAELGVAALVLAVTAVLVATPMPAP